MKPTRRNFVSSIVLFILFATAQIASAFYDPSVGRWINRDPLVDRGHAVLRPIARGIPIDDNLHRFLSNGPINHVDPHGLLLGWGYGNWCGYSRHGQNGGPIDEVDSACKNYDNCIPTLAAALTPCRIRFCNLIFCRQVANADCSSSGNPAACRSAKIDILIACAVYRTWSDFGGPFGFY